jgi:hypothetical protein
MMFQWERAVGDCLVGLNDRYCASSDRYLYSVSQSSHPKIVTESLPEGEPASASTRRMVGPKANRIWHDFEKPSERVSGIGWACRCARQEW